MIKFFISFLASWIAAFLIIRYQHIHGHLSGDSDFSAPQKNHDTVVPRVGGVAIAVGIFLAIVLELKNSVDSNIDTLIIVCAIPTFAIGLAEDITKNIGIRTRLIFTTLSALLFTHFADTVISSVGLPLIDSIFTVPLVQIIFTIFAITGLTNSYNIIDGFNGLASMIGMVTLVALSYVGYQLSDTLIFNLCIYMIGAILGFFLWNFPKGLIFMGDGGAYLIGFWIAAVTILTINRHPELSPWFAILINGYPILETIYTIFRRKMNKSKNVVQADAMHFHSLVFRKISSKKSVNIGPLPANPKTSVFIWLLAFFPMLPALIYMRSGMILGLFFLLNLIIYVSLYKWLAIGEKS